MRPEDDSTTARTPVSPVRVEKLVSGGAGLGFLDSRAVFIPLTAAGDVILPREIRSGRGVLFAEVDQVLKRSPERRDPPCPWFGTCGGCQWMHLTYPSQLRWKEAITEEAFRGIPVPKNGGGFAVHPSPRETGYRYRARLQVKRDLLGFFRRRSGRIVPWDACLLLPPELNASVSLLRSWFRSRRAPEALRSCEIALSPVDGSLTIEWIYQGTRGARAGVSFLMDAAEKGFSERGIAVAGQEARDLRGKSMERRGGGLPLKVAGAALKASPGTFFQVNPPVNEVLVQRVVGHLLSRGVGRVLDLYCGNGNFSLPAAAAGIQGLGVDSSPQAVRDAMERGGDTSRFETVDVERFLKRDRGRWDAVVVDPPRTGLPRAVSRSLAEKPCPVLVYVSCDRATLARDLALLLEGGYELRERELFDMFPQTHHAEILVVLER